MLFRSRPPVGVPVRHRIDATGDPESALLVDSFNQMTGDLKQITVELERRGRVVQTLLANIAGWLASARILTQKPLEVLRSE